MWIAIVAWEWRTGKKLVRFGQQINMCIGVQIMQEDKIVSVTIGEFAVVPLQAAATDPHVGLDYIFCADGSVR